MTIALLPGHLIKSCIDRIQRITYNNTLRNAILHEDFEVVPANVGLFEKFGLNLLNCDLIFQGASACNETRLKDVTQPNEQHTINFAS